MLSSLLSLRWNAPGLAALPLLGVALLAGCTSAATTQRIKSLEDQALVLQNRADRLEERVSGLEWAARSPGPPKAATPEDERPDLPVFRLTPGSSEPPDTRPAPDDPQPAPEKGEPVGEVPTPGSSKSDGGKGTGGATGTSGQPSSGDADAPYTRIELHRPSSELRMPRGTMRGVGGCRLGRVGLAAVTVCSEEEATCDAV